MPIRFIPYQPAPLSGQALLDTFTRTRCQALSYAGNAVLRDGLPLYESLAAEVHGDPEAAKQNLLVHGDCRAACALLRDRGIRVDLVYIDPPFASGADYAKKVVLRPNPLAPAEAAEVDSPDTGFEEKMYGDIWEKEKYLNWMYDNLMAIKSVMAEDASIYVHLDWHIGHYVKIMLDEIFGEDNFQREIIWDIQVLSGFKTIAPNWVRGHDVIYYYSKGEKRIFNKLLQPHKKEYLDSFNRVDENGRHYMIAHGTKRYRDEVEAKGKPYGDVWNDIMSFQQQPTSDEKVDYATQKPEALLERIIKASSNEGMVVADFFGGSGVTAAVAARLGRRFVTCDVNRNAIQTMRDRLVAQGTAFTQEEIQDGVALFRNPVQTMDKLCELVPGLHRLTDEDVALGIKREDWFGVINDPKEGRIPVWAPDLKEGADRVLTKETVLRLVYDVLPSLNDVAKCARFLYADLDRPVNKMEAEVNSENERSTVAVEFVDLKPYLEQAILRDDADWELTEDSEGLIKGWRLRLNAFRSDRLVKTLEGLNAKACLQPSAKGRQAITLSDEGLEGVEWVGVDTHAEGPWQSAAEVRIEPSGTVTRNGAKTKDRWDATLFCEGTDRPKRLKIRSVLGDETIFEL
ncbi:MAG TPA: site-specific DNA-methyltransferase [Candidatus Spyradenecus faecavium]|uniref:site-specific DNA-methyltransferase (adenine-specific) n=1 Tax=Candidatus Spyradenecus faecavium TaxID=2840947 RepID=A0A9D1NNI8_9BACT|nr:site-specific DNA-methyltransferase [Candidatus Spyradenecus faecavium]